MIGLGRDAAHLVAVDGQGAIDPDALARELATPGPAIVCAQAGNVNSGAFDPLEPIEYLCEQSGAWLHVDGAFGLWAAASPRYRHLTRGLERADSWATDAHKWLNVPYDGGLAIVRDRAAHRAAMSLSAAYLVAGEQRDNYDYTPEASRRARGFALYAALRSLGRNGVAELVERHCAQATRFAELLREGGAEILNDVVLNQVLVAAPPSAVARIQADGTCWVGGTVWHGREAIRISVSGWADDRRRRRALRGGDPARAQRFLRNSSTASPLLSKDVLDTAVRSSQGLCQQGKLKSIRSIAGTPRLRNGVWSSSTTPCRVSGNAESLPTRSAASRRSAHISASLLAS